MVRPRLSPRAKESVLRELAAEVCAVRARRISGLSGARGPRHTSESTGSQQPAKREAAGLGQSPSGEAGNGDAGGGETAEAAEAAESVVSMTASVAAAEGAGEAAGEVAGAFLEQPALAEQPKLVELSAQPEQSGLSEPLALPPEQLTPQTQPAQLAQQDLSALLNDDEPLTPQMLLDNPPLLRDAVRRTKGIWVRVSRRLRLKDTQIYHWFFETWVRQKCSAPVSADDRALIQRLIEERAALGLPLDTRFRTGVRASLHQTYDRVEFNVVYNNVRSSIKSRCQRLANRPLDIPADPVGRDPIAGREGDRPGGLDDPPVQEIAACANLGVNIGPTCALSFGRAYGDSGLVGAEPPEIAGLAGVAGIPGQGGVGGGNGFGGGIEAMGDANSFGGAAGDSIGDFPSQGLDSGSRAKQAQRQRAAPSLLAPLNSQNSLVPLTPKASRASRASRTSRASRASRAAERKAKQRGTAQEDSELGYADALSYPGQELCDPERDSGRGSSRGPAFDQALEMPPQPGRKAAGGPFHKAGAGPDYDPSGAAFRFSAHGPVPLDTRAPFTSSLGFANPPLPSGVTSVQMVNISPFGPQASSAPSSLTESFRALFRDFSSGSLGDGQAPAAAGSQGVSPFAFHVGELGSSPLDAALPLEAVAPLFSPDYPQGSAGASGEGFGCHSFPQVYGPDVQTPPVVLPVPGPPPSLTDAVAGPGASAAQSLGLFGEFGPLVSPEGTSGVSDAAGVSSYFQNGFTQLPAEDPARRPRLPGGPPAPGPLLPSEGGLSFAGSLLPLALSLNAADPTGAWPLLFGQGPADSADPMGTADGQSEPPMLSGTPSSEILAGSQFGAGQASHGSLPAPSPDPLFAGPLEPPQPGFRSSSVDCSKRDPPGSSARDSDSPAPPPNARAESPGPRTWAPPFLTTEGQQALGAPLRG